MKRKKMADNYSFIFSISYVHVPLPLRFVFDDVVLPFVRAVIKGQAKKRTPNVMAVKRAEWRERERFYSFCCCRFCWMIRSIGVEARNISLCLWLTLFSFIHLVLLHRCRQSRHTPFRMSVPLHILWIFYELQTTQHFARQVLKWSFKTEYSAYIVQCQRCVKKCIPFCVGINA